MCVYFKVLKKFPVVQHFMFGSIFSIDAAKEIVDPNLLEAVNSSAQRDAGVDVAKANDP